MKKEISKKLYGEVSALVCTAICLLSVSHQVGTTMFLSIFLKFFMIAFALGMLVYAVWLIIQRKKENKLLEQNNKQFEQMKESRNNNQSIV